MYWYRYILIHFNNFVLYDPLINIYFVKNIEIWHLKTLRDIGDYNDYDVRPERFTMIYTNFL